jgi:excisionase family DNA binding protein
MADRSQIPRVWLTIEEASQRTGVSKTVLYGVVRAGVLPGYRQPGEKSTWRVHVDELDHWMRNPTSAVA